VTNEELESMGVGALRIAVEDGDTKKGCFLAGQVAGLIKKEQTAGEIIEEIIKETEEILGGR
jgi:enoyl-[acyl-carrier protein] reductase II